MAKNDVLRNRRRQEEQKTIGENLSFGAAEAYKLLRTNLDFSLPDVDGGKILGVTSTTRGEGKSTTAINLAYTMAQSGKRVLLVEGDLRLPTVSGRLDLLPAPGLSNLLAGQCSANDAVQGCHLARTMHVVTAGDIPPNPAELLDSEQMRVVLKEMAKYYDMIVVDLPPVSAVSDALIVSKLLHGLVMVVRQGVCSRNELNDAIRQLKFTGCKILGFVLTDSRIHKKRYKNHYGKDYYVDGYRKHGTKAEQRPHD